jgi:hypothetical protein|tara:strand:+ start:627 stop:905 length:279 start_codon:yes stop_codon:yes gene_type:complete
MGGEFDVRVYSIDLTKSQVEDSFKGDQETSAYENGHRYSGCIGVMPFGIEWKSNMEDSVEAEEFISSNHRKWDKAWGIKTESSYIVGGWCSS